MPADRLYGAGVCHWTGKPFPLIGAVKVDGKVYRFMGQEAPILSVIVPTAVTGAWDGRYVTSEPAADWMKPDFNDSSWTKGEGAFGTVPAEALAKTNWDTEFIWTRRNFDIDPAVKDKPLFLNYSHDDDVIIYVNGIKVVDTGNQCHKDQIVELSDEVKATLKPQDNVIAAWCRDRGGLSFLDYGIECEVTDSRFLDEEATQTSAIVDPMNTLYTFTCGPVDLSVKFTAPAFLDNFDLLSRPVNYLTYDVESNDGKAHDVKLYIEAGKEWALNTSAQNATMEVVNLPAGLCAVTATNVEQNPLNKAGDDVRIDWGKFYLATDTLGTTPFLADGIAARRAFIAGNPVTESGERMGFIIITVR